MSSQQSVVINRKVDMKSVIVTPFVLDEVYEETPDPFFEKFDDEQFDLEMKNLRVDWRAEMIQQLEEDLHNDWNDDWSYLDDEF